MIFSKISCIFKYTTILRTSFVIRFVTENFEVKNDADCSSKKIKVKGKMVQVLLNEEHFSTINGSFALKYSVDATMHFLNRIFSSFILLN